MKKNPGVSIFAAVVAILTMGLPMNLLAATNGFIIPSFRNSVGSEIGYWETFAVASGLPGNSADQSGASTHAILTQMDTNAFLTGSGNIYNLETSSFELTDTPGFSPENVVLQTRTVGAELDYNSVLLVYTDGTGIHSVAPLFRYELNRGTSQGFSVSSLWQWDLTGRGIAHYKIVFVAGGASLSFDSLTLDTARKFSPAFPQQPFALSSTPATLARWMYPFNGSPGNRPTASVFASLGSSPDFDSRDAQYLLGWSTTNRIPSGQGVTNYLIRKARVTLTIASQQYTYSGTLRDYRSYFPTNDPRYVAPASSRSSVELFGAGFRAGYTSTSYPQDGPWPVDPNAGYHANRVVYSAGFNTNGVLVDVSNNVGDDEVAEITGAFEVAPFAVGQSANVAPGQVMAVGDQLTFDINLADPLIYGYVQAGLNEGNLSFVASTLLNGSFSGAPNYPNFYTIFSPIATARQYPLLDIEGEIVRSNLDGDADGLPDDWENFYFGSLINGAAADPDGDGVNNLSEFRAGTVPTSNTSQFRLLSVQSLGDGTEIHFNHSAGHFYSVLWSENLTDWLTVANPHFSYSSAWLAKTGTNLVYPSPVYGVWRDTNSSEAKRFYKVGIR